MLGNGSVNFWVLPGIRFVFFKTLLRFVGEVNPLTCSAGVWLEREQDGRLPPAYFAPSHFGEDTISKIKTLFFEKKRFFFIFSSFPNVQRFLFFFAEKNPIMRAQKNHFDLIRILQIYYLKRSRKYSIFFFEKLISFSRKTPNFERFEKWYYFSRILGQSCYNLMKKKFDIKTRERPMLARLTRAQLANIGLKKRTYLRGRFFFPYFQYGAKYLTNNHWTIWWTWS